MKKLFKKTIIITMTAVIIFLIAACATFKIASVEWDTLEGPSRARQYINISTSEVKVFANYENGDRRLASAGALSYDRSKAGVQTVTVTLGRTAGGSFETEIMELISIRVSTPPTKTTYNVGERLETTGIRLTGTWREMPDMEIPAYLMLLAPQSGFDSSSPGRKTVTLTWNGKSATFPVTIVQPAPAAAPATAAAAATPAATTPSTQSSAQQSTQQTTQPAAAQQQPVPWNPASNQPAPVGRWKSVIMFGGLVNWYTFNADGTGTHGSTSAGTESNSPPADTNPITWTASGNQITVTEDFGDRKHSSVMTYEVLGRILKMKFPYFNEPTTFNKL